MALVAVSMGKTVTGINGNTVHFALNLSTCTSGKQFCCREPSDVEFYNKRHF